MRCNVGAGCSPFSLQMVSSRDTCLFMSSSVAHRRCYYIAPSTYCKCIPRERYARWNDFTILPPLWLFSVDLYYVKKLFIRQGHTLRTGRNIALDSARVPLNETPGHFSRSTRYRPNNSFLLSREDKWQLDFLRARFDLICFNNSRG